MTAGTIRLARAAAVPLPPSLSVAARRSLTDAGPAEQSAELGVPHDVDPATGDPTLDLDGNGALDLDEDFPLDSYPDGDLVVYPRPLMHALPGALAPPIAAPDHADAYWDTRGSVQLYDEALDVMPDLDGTALCSVLDHVECAPGKPHIRQAFEGWPENGGWVQINPSPDYVAEVDPSLEGRGGLPANDPDSATTDWPDTASCAMPEDVVDGIYQLAAVWEMADRAHEGEPPSDGQSETGWCPGSLAPAALITGTAINRLRARRRERSRSIRRGPMDKGFQNG